MFCSNCCSVFKRPAIKEYPYPEDKTVMATYCSVMCRDEHIERIKRQDNRADQCPKFADGMHRYFQDTEGFHTVFFCRCGRRDRR